MSAAGFRLVGGMPRSFLRALAGCDGSFDGGGAQGHRAHVDERHADSATVGAIGAPPEKPPH